MFKAISHYWQKRRERFYLKSHWHLILDLSLGLIIVLLIGITISLSFYKPVAQSPYIQSIREKAKIDLNNPPLVLTYSLVSSSSHLTEGVELKVSFTNNSKLLIKNVKTDFLVVDKNFVISRIDNVNKSDDIEINNNQVSLNSLGENESKDFILKFYFKDKSNTERIIKWQAQNEYLVSDQLIKELVNLSDINLAAELTGSARAYYNSPQGDQLGSGPLPPVVGLPTNYWIFFDLKSAGDFKDLVFSAKLPKEVELTDRRSLLAGDFKYNSASRQIIWTIPELKNQSDSYRVGFEIQFVPNEGQVDKVALLLNNIKYYAHDILVNAENYVELPEVTTNLDFDRLNNGNGKIGLPQY
ncbi:MAG: hypothetical protein ACOYL8_04410 [Patescibacteria group bacterium]